MGNQEKIDYKKLGTKYLGVSRAIWALLGIAFLAAVIAVIGCFVYMAIASGYDYT
jgi:hypothetical protein